MVTTFAVTILLIIVLQAARNKFYLKFTSLIMYKKQAYISTGKKSKVQKIYNKTFTNML